MLETKFGDDPQPKRIYEIFGMDQTRIYIYVVMLPLPHLFSTSCYLPKYKLSSARNTP